MKSRITVLFLLCAVGCARPSTVPDAQVQAEDTRTEAPTLEQGRVDDLAQQFIAGEWSRGIAIGLVRGDKVEFFNYGTLADDSTDPITEHTVFEIGSVTKVFTSMVLARRVAAGELDLADPVDRCLGEEMQLSEGVRAHLTFGRLASHSSGLMRLPTNLAPADASDPYVDYGAAELAAFLATYESSGAPESNPYIYSNLGAGLLGYALARCSGEASYGEMISTALLEPMALKETGLTREDLSGLEWASPHDSSGFRVAPWYFDALAGAGALRSTSSDMASFVRQLIAESGAESELGRALELATTRRATGPAGDVGLGWHLVSDGELAGMRWHNGQTAGFHSFVAFIPEREVGVVVLSNTGQPAIDQLGQSLLLELSGGSAELELPGVVDVDPSLLGSYIGRYEGGPFVFEVTLKEGKLFAQLANQPAFRVWPESSNKFYYRVVEASLVFDEPVDGKSPRVTLFQNGQVIPFSRSQ